MFEQQTQTQPQNISSKFMLQLPEKPQYDALGVLSNKFVFCSGMRATIEIEMMSLADIRPKRYGRPTLRLHRCHRRCQHHQRDSASHSLQRTTDLQRYKRGWTWYVVLFVQEDTRKTFCRKRSLRTHCRCAVAFWQLVRILLTRQPR